MECPIAMDDALEFARGRGLAPVGHGSTKAPAASTRHDESKLAQDCRAVESALSAMAPDRTALPLMPVGCAGWQSKIQAYLEKSGTTWAKGKAGKGRVDRAFRKLIGDGTIAYATQGPSQ